MAKKSEQKFTGKINGVTYTNIEDFQKALDSMAKEKINSIEYQEYQAEVNEKKSDNKKHKIPFEYDLNNLFTEMFDAFLGALAGHNYLKHIEQYIDKNDAKKLQEGSSPQAKKIKKVEVEELIKEYIFNETTYEFTGGEEDELALNEFDQFLQNKFDMFKKVDFSTRSGDELSDFLLNLRNPFMNRLKEVTVSINKEDEQLKDLYIQMVNLENCINANSLCGFDTAIINAKYKSVQHELDILQNFQNYHRLLKQYFTHVINHIDQQF